jgi:hypothetical protein
MIAQVPEELIKKKEKKSILKHFEELLKENELF